MVKRDPSIRIAIERLAERIPNLATRVSNGQTFFTDGPGGVVTGKIKNGVFKVSARRLQDGSLVQSTKEACSTIKKLLKSKGDFSAGQIARAIDDAPEARRIRLSDMLSVIKWPVRAIQPKLDGPMIDDTVLLKISYEYLALHLGRSVLRDVPTLACIRDVLRSETQPVQTFYKIERLRGDEYAPFHGIALMQLKPHPVILVRLFGWLAFRVHLPGVTANVARTVYTCCLDTNEEELYAWTTQRPNIVRHTAGAEATAGPWIGGNASIFTVCR